MSDADLAAYYRMYSAMYALREPVVRAALDRLDFPSGSRGLDAGCATGQITKHLAKAISPGGHVTGLDISDEHLNYARESLSEDLKARIDFRHGDINSLPFDDGSFDWVWSMDTIWPGSKEIGCPAEDTLPIVKELARVVIPGGKVALLYWSTQKVLPGYPHLEARLNTTSGGLAPFTGSMAPEQHFMRCMGWLRRIGLTGVGVATFAGEAFAPLDDDIRDALTAIFPMLWSGMEHEVSEDDWAEYERLCLPESPDFILNYPDYYGFFTYTLFYGTSAS